MIVRRPLRALAIVASCIVLSIESTGAAEGAAAKGRASTARAASKALPSYAERADVMRYVDDLVASAQFDRGELMRLLRDAHYSETAARLMRPAASTGQRRDWQVYRARFVEPIRLAAGFQFWEDNEATLARAERDFGVPPEIVVGILGVETVYGRNTGSFRVLDALATLSFDYPNKERDRSAFFREQLTDALAMDRDGELDLATLRGSYAGAIGIPQFMPGSILRYAIDYDGDGRIDLVNSAADAIGSVANFLAQNGWVRDLTTHVPLTYGEAGRATSVDASQAARIDAMVAAGSEPGIDFPELADIGFVAQSLRPIVKLALIDLPLGTGPDGVPRTAYLAGTQNFHAITRYNRSYFYALSVIELGATIKALRDARDANPSNRN